jgi:PAS domain S-box-containing protein
MDNKHTIKHLQEALDYAESIIATVREPLLVLDADLRVITANPAFYRVFSAAPGDIEGKHIYEISDGQLNIPALRELLETILPKNTRFENFELDHEFTGLGRRIMLLNARRIHDGGETTQRILLAIEDITERKRLQGYIEASELRYRRLFEAAQDGILILDADTGEITDANPFLMDLLGYSKQYLLGKRLWELGFFKDAESSRQAFHVLQEKGYIRYENLPLMSKDGRSMQVEFVSNLYAVNGSRVIQCNIRDITERKKAERMRDEFIGVISHEIKNPLTIIKGSVMTAANENATPEQHKELLEQANEEIENIVNLVENLLELARQQSGRLVLQTHPVDIAEGIQSVIKKLKKASAIHHLTQDIAPGLPRALADAFRVERVIHNLVENAIKYSPKGGEVKVAARRDGDFLLMSVSDNGPGISPENQARLFQSFERLEESVDKSIFGTGLGLRVCRILVEAHKGRIWVESDPDRGSTFYFTLPVAK